MRTKLNSLHFKFSEVGKETRCKVCNAEEKTCSRTVLSEDFKNKVVQKKGIELRVDLRWD